MRQKLGLAVALVHRPPILLLDEPTTGVDPITRQDFWQLIIRLVSEEGIAVLVSTPYMDEAVRCTQVFFMRQGHLLVSGPPDTLRLSLKGRIMEVRGQPLKLIRQVARQDVDVEDAQMFGDRLHLRLRADTSEQVMARLGEVVPAMGGKLTRLRLIPPQLEDVFITLLETPQ